MTDKKAPFIVPFCVQVDQQAIELSATCFVAMSFDKSLQVVYDHVLKPAIQAEGFGAVRADEMWQPGVIVEQVTRELNRAACVVADLTNLRPSVLYEVGYAHGVGKPVILLVDESQVDDVRQHGFDVAHLRCIPYQPSIPGARLLEERLREALRKCR